MGQSGDTQFLSIGDIQGTARGPRHADKRKRGRQAKGDKVNARLLIGVPIAVFVLAVITAVLSITDGRPFDKVAATIGTEYRLYEDDVTEYVQSNRKRMGITDDDSWRKWLEKNNLTVADVRTQTIDYFVHMHILERECKRLGIEVTEKDIDRDIQDTKGAYGYTDDEWAEQLASRGYDDKSYRDDVHDRLLSKSLFERVTSTSDGGLEPNAVLNVIKDNADTFKSATKVSCIVLRDDEKDKADEISNKLASDPSGFNRLKEEDSESSLYDGWTIASEVSSVLTNQVMDNQVGDITGQIKLEDNGVIVIAKITDKASVEGDITAVSQLPTDLIDAITDNMASSGRNERLSDYLDDLVSKTNVHINETDITQLPYYVDVTESDADLGGSTDNRDDENPSGDDEADHGSMVSDASD